MWRAPRLYGWGHDGACASAHARLQVAAAQRDALAEDPSCFEYDAFFDDIQTERATRERGKFEADQGGPKYLTAMMAARDDRKRGADMAFERREALAAAAEGEGEFAGACPCSAMLSHICLCMVSTASAITWLQSVLSQCARSALTKLLKHSLSTHKQAHGHTQGSPRSGWLDHPGFFACTMWPEAHAVQARSGS